MKPFFIESVFGSMHFIAKMRIAFTRRVMHGTERMRIGNIKRKTSAMHAFISCAAFLHAFHFPLFLSPALNLPAGAFGTAFFTGVALRVVLFLAGVFAAVLSLPRVAARGLAARVGR